MSTTESERHELYEIAKHTGGDRFAELMIKSLPPHPEQLATKDDLAVLSRELRGEMAELRGELRTEMAELRGDLRTEMRDLTINQTRTLMLGLVGSITALTVTELVVGRFG